MQSSPSQREFFEIKKSLDPAGTGLVGYAGGYNMQAGAVGHPVLHYKPKGKADGFFLTADVFAPEGAPMYVLIYCPLCQNMLKIAADNKKLEYEPHETPRIPGFRPEEVLAATGLSELGGVLSVERFRCAWEPEPSLRRSFGFGVCTFQVVIDRNVVRDA